MTKVNPGCCYIYPTIENLYEMGWWCFIFAIIRKHKRIYKPAAVITTKGLGIYISRLLLIGDH